MIKTMVTLHKSSCRSSPRAMNRAGGGAPTIGATDLHQAVTCRSAAPGAIYSQEAASADNHRVPGHT